jgi:hypothetical protein
MTPKDMLP